MRNEIFDVFIVGAGPIGLACAISAKKAGLKYIIADKGVLVNSIYNYPLNMTFFSTSERLEIGNIPFMTQGIKPGRAEALEYFRRVAQVYSIKVNLYEEVYGAKKNENLYTVTTIKDEYFTRNIIICTGFYDIPNLLNVEGEKLPKVFHYYKEPHPFYNQKIIVVGAANSAVDVALETFRKGAKVTMVIREDTISDRVKYWVRPDIENRIKEGSIKVFYNSEIIKIRENDVDVKTPRGIINIKNDFVLAMTGYMPDFALLSEFGISLSGDHLKIPYHNPETMETNKKNIYLAGVICGGMETHKWFIENSRMHADLIINNIVKNRGKVY